MKNKAHEVELPTRFGVRPRYRAPIGLGWESRLRRMVRLVAGTGAVPAAAAAPVWGKGWWAL